MGVLAAVFLKDLRAELRSPRALLSMGVFALLTVVVFGFAFESHLGARVGGSAGPGFAVVIAPGLLWVALAFSGILGLNRSFTMEREAGALSGLLLSPADRGSIYLGKTLANATLIMAVEILVLPMYALLFNIEVLRSLGRLAPVGVLGALGFSAAGTVLAGIAAGTRMRDMLLPLLLFPISAPVLIAAVEATAVALTGEGEGYSDALRFLAGFAVINLSASYLVFGFVLEE